MKRIPVLVGILVLFLAATVHADLLTSNTIVNPTVIDFSQFTGANQQINIPGLNQVPIGGLVNADVNALTGGNSQLSLFNGTWNLGSNGEWDSGRTGFAAATTADPTDITNPTTLAFIFNTPVSSVGAFMNDAPNTFPGLFIFAYDSNGTTLEVYNIWADGVITTPGGINDGVFRGISRPTADIWSFSINGYRPAIDDLAFGYSGAAPVPEPASILLFGTGCVALGGYLRRKLKK
jgi:hypothetical protein